MAGHGHLWAVPRQFFLVVSGNCSEIFGCFGHIPRLGQMYGLVSGISGSSRLWAPMGYAMAIFPDAFGHLKLKIFDVLATFLDSGRCMIWPRATHNFGHVIYVKKIDLRVGITAVGSSNLRPHLGIVTAQASPQPRGHHSLGQHIS